MANELSNVTMKAEGFMEVLSTQNPCHPSENLRSTKKKRRDVRISQRFASVAPTLLADHPGFLRIDSPADRPSFAMLKARQFLGRLSIFTARPEEWFPCIDPSAKLRSMTRGEARSRRQRSFVTPFDNPGRIVTRILLRGYFPDETLFDDVPRPCSYLRRRVGR